MIKDFKDSSFWINIIKFAYGVLSQNGTVYIKIVAKEKILVVPSPCDPSLNSGSCKLASLSLLSCTAWQEFSPPHFTADGLRGRGRGSV